MKFKFLKESMLNLLQDMNIDVETTLIESKADEQRLIDFAGEDLAQRYMLLRKRLKSPYNDLYFWIKYKTVDELRTAIEEVESDAQHRKDAENGAKLVAENDYWKVYHITTFEAAKKYGRDTKWCITGVDGYGRKYWDEYTSSGVNFYFFITKDEYDPRGRFGKYAVAINNNATRYENSFKVYDQQDNDAYGIPNAPLVNGIPDVNTVDMTHLVYDGEIPANLNRAKIETIEITPEVTHIPFSMFTDFILVKEVTIPKNVKSIGTFAFKDCTNLERVLIEDGVVSIEELAFYNCPNLSYMRIPNSVTNITSKSLMGCPELVVDCDQDSVTHSICTQNNIKIV